MAKKIWLLTFLLVPLILCACQPGAQSDGQADDKSSSIKVPAISKAVEDPGKSETSADPDSLKLPAISKGGGSLPTPLTPLPDCPITVPNGSQPPGEETPSSFYHGNGQIWTSLWPDGKVIIPLDSVEPDGSLGMKFPWWHSLPGKLQIEGRRLDAEAPPLVADIPEGYAETGFQASGIFFSSQGCWEITAFVGETSLTLVTLVVVETP